MLMDETNHTIQIRTLDENENAIMFEIKTHSEDDGNYISLSKFMEQGIDDIDTVCIPNDKIDLIINSLKFAKENLMAQPTWNDK